MLATAEQASEACNRIMSKVAHSELASTIKATLVKTNEDLPSNGEIFIRHLPETFTEGDLKKIFGAFGAVLEQRLFFSRREGVPHTMLLDACRPRLRLGTWHKMFVCLRNPRAVFPDEVE